MGITDSRLKGGTLTLDAHPFAKQQTSVKLTPKTDEDGDAVEALSGDKIEPDDVTTWELGLGAVQDFDDPQGFVEFCRSNAGDVVAFVWKPNAAGAPTYDGTLKVRPVEIGGDVASRLTTEATFPVITGPNPTYPEV